MLLETLSTLLASFLFVSGLIVIYRMTRKTAHARRVAWVIVTTGALGVLVCGLTGVEATDYYVLTLSGVAVLVLCGFRGSCGADTAAERCHDA